MTNKKKSTWNSQFGFILATAGAAVGLGNILRFPYVVVKSGGSSFLLVYLAAVLLLAFPLMLLELSFGRKLGGDPWFALRKLETKNKLWQIVGLFPVLVAFFILSYYSAAVAWTLLHASSLVFQGTQGLENLMHNGTSCILSTLSILALSTFIVLRGVKEGIEKICKVLMPLLFFLLISLALWALQLEGAQKGLEYYLYPDWSKLNSTVFIEALTQAFFSLCIGEAVLVTYGSLADKNSNLLVAASWAAFFDTAVAFLAGLMIFPMIFALQIEPVSGIELAFQVVPKALEKVYGGQVIAVSFLLILVFAGITTCIALMEVTTTALTNKFHLSRKKSVLIVALLATPIALAVCLSKGASSLLSDFELSCFQTKGLYESMDWIWGSLGMVLASLALTLFLAWKWDLKKLAKELEINSPFFTRISSLWIFHVRFTVPILIIFILYGIIA